jgi:hypothetical protein
MAWAIIAAVALLAACLLAHALVCDNSPVCSDTSILAVGDFQATHRFDRPGTTSLLLDTQNERLAVARPGKPLAIHGLAELLSIAIERNGTSILTCRPDLQSTIPNRNVSGLT